MAFGNYVAPGTPGSPTGAEVAAALDAFLALLGRTSPSRQLAAHPDFNLIPPAAVALIEGEIAAIKSVNGI